MTLQRDVRGPFTVMKPQRGKRPAERDKFRPYSSPILKQAKASINIPFLIVFFTFLLFTKIYMSVNHIKLWEEGSDEPFRITARKSVAEDEEYKNTKDLLDGENIRHYDNDEQAFSLIRNHFLDPPSNHSYNLQENLPGDSEYTSYKTAAPSWVFINSVLFDLYKDKPPGFFVEAGALDGEHLSNTLQLERKLNWTGLLVEAEEQSYKQLLNKNRKSWSSQCCLATKPYPHEAVLTTYTKKKRPDWWHRGAARLHQNGSSSYSLDGPGYPNFKTVFCIPVDLLLGSLSVTHVDFFSLDVEGVETDVIENFPFDKITVDVWAIEHLNPNLSNIRSPHTPSNANNSYRIEDPTFISFMENNGYYLFDVLCEDISDYIFLRIESHLFKDLAVPKNLRQRRGICQQKELWDPKLPAKPSYLRDKRHWPFLKFQSE